MRFENDKFSYEIDDKYPSKIIDEFGNKHLQLAKYKWNGKGDFKLGIRNYYSNSDGEHVGSGISFLTEDGPNDLINALLENGHGNPDDIVKTCLEKRPEICGAFISAFDEIDINNCSKLIHFRDSYDALSSNSDNNKEEEFYDPEELLS